MSLADQSISFMGVQIPKEIIFAKTHDKTFLQGFAVNNNEGYPLYVGALLTSEPEKLPAMLFLKDLSMTMIFFIVQEDVSSDTIVRIFTEELILNNPGWDKDKLNQIRLEELASLFKQAMNVGDKIEFQYSSEDNLSVFINGTFVKSWKNSRSLFNAILRIWIGPYPPSRDFKNNVLGGE